MSTALFTGLSGLRAHETYLDVIGNNIANANTIGYRGSRVTFGDLLSRTLSPGSGPSATKGGTNPEQIGLGVGVNSINVNTNAGSLIATNRNLDLTVFGPGFFVVNDGASDLFTRAGTFALDGQGQLVELGTGFLVQDISGSSITVPPNAISPPEQTSEVTVKGNLPATIEGPLAEILTSAPYADGISAQLSGGIAGPYAFTDGDAMTLEVNGGVPQTVNFLAADFTAIGANIASATTAEVATIISQQLIGATAIDNGGVIEISSTQLGDQSSLKVTDAVGNPAFIMGLPTVLSKGSQSNANSSTDLNDLVNNVTDYANGDGIVIEGIDKDGNDFGATFVYGTDGTTLGDLQTYLDGLVPGASVAFDPTGSGSLVITADVAGEAQFAIKLTDAPTNTGATEWGSTSFGVSQNGTAPDSVLTAITVFDQNGTAHILNLTFERIQGTEWQLTASLPDESGTLIPDPSVGNITFSNDGILSTAGGTGVDDASIEIIFPTGSQTIALNIGDPGDINGLTHFGGSTTAQAIAQDGFSSGSLADIQVTEDGNVRGIFTNGEVTSYGTLAIATFANSSGLIRSGSNMFTDSVNSGVPLIGSGGAAGGTIQAGVLETSNVDLAEEFVRMIEAQRGYQASARVIRASEELLQNLLQNI